MPADPVGWLRSFLRDRLGDFLRQRDVAVLGEDLDTIRSTATEVGAVVEGGLAWAREPWPDVDHDERGMARVR
jgi:hypothetical protein